MPSRDQRGNVHGRDGRFAQQHRAAAEVTLSRTSHREQAAEQAEWLKSDLSRIAGYLHGDDDASLAAANELVGQATVRLRRLRADVARTNIEHTVRKHFPDAAELTLINRGSSSRPDWEPDIVRDGDRDTLWVHTSNTFADEPWGSNLIMDLLQLGDDEDPDPTGDADAVITFQ
ncbi:hypothetical protein [Curtobacterium sp. MCBD17_040]|uniref:hypothetical protein n=1 Tax=Curtobacterium sp. MCBD17_040 TaxID=2175674 RepID=UPI000DA75C16|nr:hypothetical protein [Curtobacterium sp. MCBD17_040]WIB65709.1 hypothetical protein DEI94_16440 [Curtobacterium sp. MCBD17_040]